MTVLCFYVATLLSIPPADAQDMVPFVIPARIDTTHAIWLSQFEPITTDAPRLVARDSHFYRGAERVRIWGVNLSFGANFPTHEDATHVATRLAAAGVNSVRCHHMDTSRWPRGIWDAQTGRTLEPQALDRLDYFINELAQRGICVNINLHVGRAHSEYLRLPQTNREYDKMSGIFTPALVEAQTQFARDLLGHVNAYRNVRYADDPAIAFVEISNEDSLLMWGAEETLRTLPAYYANILQGQFNAWLRRKYDSDAALRQAWTQGTQPLGDNLLNNGSLTSWNSQRRLPRDWNLEQHENCRASLSTADGTLRVTIDNADDTSWHLQLTQAGLALTQGRYYTASFDAKTDRPRQISCSVGQAHEPWNNLGLSREVQLTNEMQRFSFGFVTTADESNARISFAFSGDATPFNLARVELRPGGQVALAEGESRAEGTIGLYRDNESRARILDRMMFLAETEKAYFDGMRHFIKNDLGCQALVTGTVVFGPLGQYAQSDMDFVDSHAYWQHPRFPGRPWDAGNWIVEQRPMTDHPEQATLFRVAAERLAGKPFTLSEYNHPAPLDAQAECVPMVASFAAAQDWDGVWLYTYSHSSDNWAREHLNSYFDIDTNPAKWGFMRAGAALFRYGGVAPLNGIAYSSLVSGDGVVNELATLHLRHGSDMLRTTGLLREAMLKGQYIAAISGRNEQYDIRSPGALTQWTVDQGKGIYTVQSRAGSVHVGHAEQLTAASNGTITIDAPEFVALTIAALDDKERIPLAGYDQILVTACGRCENTGMGFSDDRRTVGRNWGEAPVQIEPVEGRVVLPRGWWTCQALAPDGSPKQPVPVSYEDNRGILKLSPQFATMWYLLRRGE
ncbi:MAG: carbohydrate binding domain-containing protein [Sedimentisphaerales bacterium]|nr:carbohydrate binding domain-containing protein [Sedimentisphaerales bacterium]